MALRITDATTVINVAQSNISNFSLGFWFRRPTTTITDAVSIASGLGRELYESTTTLYVSGKSPPSPAVQPATGEWRYLTITKNGGNWAVYAFLDQGAQSASAIWDDYGPVSAANIGFGDVSGPYATPLLNMEIAYARAWSSVLTLTQLNTEKNSTTPVITSGLITNLPFIDSLTATSGTSATNSGSGYDFTANLPLVLSGGGSVIDPGVILAQLAGVFGPDRGFGFGY